MQTAVSSGVPVLNGVLNCPTMELALERAGGSAGNKGKEAALAAIEMVSLLKKLPAAEARADTRQGVTMARRARHARSCFKCSIRSTSIPTSPRERSAT